MGIKGGMARIKFIIEDKEIVAELIDRNPKTAKLICEKLPLESNVNTWGDEIYFGAPLKIAEEKAQEEVEVGDVAYWVEGRCICIFFGATPISKSGKPLAYSPVNVFAKVVSGLELLKTVVPGSVIKVEKC
ncbi:MAG: cyclophilin-like fold protein [Candidatus Thermoplasmatota archaeon]|nr:cyclophilin-like fold protein [Candidatus Thermoplasmatota archaeon]MDI6855454.1 cyclophilin-like fold protein [Candidatus Thermoplasmatota archaeon]